LFNQNDSVKIVASAGMMQNPYCFYGEFRSGVHRTGTRVYIKLLIFKELIYNSQLTFL